jgi:hypothetical protein
MHLAGAMQTLSNHATAEMPASILQNLTSATTWRQHTVLEGMPIKGCEKPQHSIYYTKVGLRLLIKRRAFAVAGH